MDSIRARAAATAASLAVLAALAACSRHPEVKPIAQAPQPDAVALDDQQAAQQAHLQSLGAKGGTSVLDPDVLLSERVKAALASHPDLGSSASVAVRSKNGEVTLRGRAPDPATRDRAAEIARSIPQVRSVDNQLTLG